MKSIKRFFLTLALMTVAIAASAQGKSIHARLVDSTTGEVIPYATTSITLDGQTKPAQYVLSADDGIVDIYNVKKGKYVFKAELLGYKTYTITLDTEKDKLRLGDIKMEPDAQQLDAATVSDVGNPITVKKDTIEYNVTLFKQGDNDMLVDLLRKLPGIEVDNDGTISANGKTVNKITIDGKTFFLNDPQLATSNLPSKIIEKIKVIDKKSEQAEFTGIDDGQEETIIDLSVQKGMMNGWMGNLAAGGGHDIPSANNTMNKWRYTGNGFIANFTESQQISIILNANNANAMGFGNMAGNMMGAMMGGMGGRGGMGGGMPGGGNGETTSWMGGVNGAWTLLDNKMDLSANYVYNGSIQDAISHSQRDTYTNASDVLNYITDSKNHTYTNGHRFGARMEHRFSKSTSILFEPQFNFGNGNYVNTSEYETYNNIRTKDYVYQADPTKADFNMANNGFSSNSGVNQNWTASGRFLLRQRLGKAGRTMTVNLNYNLSNNLMDGFNQSVTTTYMGTQPKQDIVNQRIDQKSRNTSLTGTVTYTEPIYRQSLFMEANYSYTYSNQHTTKDAYDSGAVENAYNAETKTFNYSNIGETYDATYSNEITNISHNQRAGVNLRYQRDFVNAQVGLTANPTKTINTTISGNGNKDYENFVLNWAPTASLRFEIGDNNNLRINYNGRSSQPTTNQLMPVPDNSNPLNISLGNPNLTPYFSHSMSTDYRFTDRQSFTSFSLGLNGGMTQNPIINTSWYEAGGRQFSLPVNGPDSYNASVRLMLNSPIARSNFTVNNNFNISYNQSSNYVKNTTGSLDMNNYYNDGVFDYDKFTEKVIKTDVWGQNFDINKTQNMSFSENFRLTYRCDLVEVTAGVQTRMNKAWYSVSQGNTNATWSSSANLQMNWNIPGGVQFIPEYTYRWYAGYTTEQPDAHMLNVQVNKSFLNGTMTVALRGYDLLGQTRNLSVSDTANYHSESVNNSLGRYVIVSLTWRFGSFGGRGNRGGNRGGNSGGAQGGRPNFGGGMPPMMGGGMPMGRF